MTVGVESIYSFVVTDFSNFTVTIEGGSPQDGLLLDVGQGRYSFSWTPASTPTQNLSFIAQDSVGAVTIHSPILQVCTCFNGGQCTVDGVQSTDLLVRNLTCICTEGMILLHASYSVHVNFTYFHIAFDGDTCSEDKNGCSEIECFRGVECQDIPAPGVGAVCGACPTGFTGDGLKCSGIT